MSPENIPDKGSSADVLFYKVYEQMEQGNIPLEPVDTLLFGFVGEIVHLLRQILIPISLDMEPTRRTRMVHFLVQKKRHFGLKKDKIIREEVSKLLAAGHIKEIQSPKWLSNAVLESKPDQLVNSTSGHELLSLMDASRGYQQIMLNPIIRIESSLPFFKALRKTKNFVWDEEC
ncbi:hypothetical protein Sango_3087700 [Sesamum angolense]|uniref:Uncharacterized protein n=1 Tax=Sesamum angolense TaxID=2727404 RepID=A0AAE1VYN9_9LAMI|nr:hypothetical protein Sango_3087700 [Sesamum angolense]